MNKIYSTSQRRHETKMTKFLIGFIVALVGGILSIIRIPLTLLQVLTIWTWKINEEWSRKSGNDLLNRYLKEK